jgi:hypothetical protein
MFQLVFPQPNMLSDEDFREVANALERDPDDKVKLRDVAEHIRSNLNPHPAGQKTHNVPMFEGKATEGIQHKYKETVLFFPTEVETKSLPPLLPD